MSQPPTRGSWILLALLLSACRTSTPDIRQPEPPTPTHVITPAPSERNREPAPAEPESTSEPTPLPPAAQPAVRARLSDGEALFAAIREQLQPPVCAGGALATRWRQRLARHPASIETQLRAALPRMARVTEAIMKAGLPAEFVFIPLIESGYRPTARGRGGPAGLWQFMAGTARAHGLRVDSRHDERLDPDRATAAAVEHLAVLQQEFGDWRASALAYNAGMGAVRRAFSRSGAREVDVSARRPSGLSSISYAYVAKLDAWSCLITHPDRYGLNLPTDAFTPLPNPEHPATEMATSPPAITPPDTGTPPATPATSPGIRRHQIQPGDTLWSLARRFGTTVAALRASNALADDDVLAVGRWLIVP